MKLPKYVQAGVDDEGRAHCYFGYPRVRLPGPPWSPFMAAYEAALAGPRAAIGAGRIKPRSVSAVVAAYLDSQQFFGSKGAGTQRMRRGILERVRAAYGDRPSALLPAEWIEALLDAKPPHAARSWLVTLRSLCQFALKRGWLRTDSTANIKLRPIKRDGFHTWTDDEIAQFEAHHPIGTKPRLALALLLYTAQRRGDVVEMGRQHIRDGVLTVKQQKTGITLAIPVHSHLQAVLDATPSAHLTFLGPRPASLTAATISARVSGNGATPPDCRSGASRTDCARPRAADSRKPDAAPMRSPPSADTRASMKWPATPAQPIRRGSPATCWRGGGKLREGK
jgi:integrase